MPQQQEEPINRYQIRAFHELPIITQCQASLGVVVALQARSLGALLSFCIAAIIRLNLWHLLLLRLRLGHFAMQIGAL